MSMYRQGDVLLRKVKKMPTGLKPVPEDKEKDKGRVVLAYGEVTGHAHAIDKRTCKLFRDDASGSRFLEVSTATALVHEEHARIPLDPGFYEVIQQVEYTPQGSRNVAD